MVYTTNNARHTITSDTRLTAKQILRRFLMSSFADLALLWSDIRYSPQYPRTSPHIGIPAGHST
jgi:hypothetical protein